MERTQSYVREAERWSAHNYAPLPVVIERGDVLWVPPYFWRTGTAPKQGFMGYVPVNLFAVVLLPVIAYLMLPLHRRRRRRRLGLCITCGYDLSGSSASCSECGTKKQ